MTTRATLTASLLILAGLGQAACSNTGGPSLATASVANQPVTTAAKIDPACSTLANQIETLRAEGIADRVEKASTGKTTNVQVKRASLAKQAELNKAHADFQTRCSVAIPRAQSAAVSSTPAASSTAAQAAANGAATAATGAKPTAASTAKAAMATQN